MSDWTRKGIAVICICLALTFLFPWTMFTVHRTSPYQNQNSSWNVKVPYPFFLSPPGGGSKDYDWLWTKLQATVIVFGGAGVVMGAPLLNGKDED